VQLERGSIVSGRYRLERPLAQGAMGCVWVAHHLQLDVDVAIKLMAPGFAESDEARIRFEREAKASALLKVPNAVHVYDYGIEAGSPYLVMELLEGEDLAARLKRQGRLSLAATLAVLEPIGKALRRARELGLVHRDLKPGNIFLARSGDEEIVKVVDFGIAKAAASLGLDAHATRTGSLLGSPRYMSPEQVRRSNHIDHRSDLWAVGVIAFECTTGQVPFPGDEIGEVLVDVCTAPIPRASSIAPDLGPDVDLFFDHALMRDPDKRFQSAQELVEAFAALVHAGAPAQLGSPSFAALPQAASPLAASSQGAAPAVASHSVSASTSPSSSGLRAPPPSIGTLSPSASTQGHAASPSRGGAALLAVLSALGGAAVLGAILFALASRGPSVAPPAARTTVSAEAAPLPVTPASAPASPSSDSAAPQPPPSAEAPPSASTAAPSAKPRTGPTARPTTPGAPPKKTNDLLNHM
jgi:eukaryotic-like serine/threonine-protein kinase